MKRLFSLLLLVFCTTGLYAQHCYNVITNDEAGIIKDSAKVEQGAGPLINQGVDVHVVTVSSIRKYGVRLFDVEKAYERICPNWLAPNGARKANLKANLAVLMVAPNDGAKSAFLGASFWPVFLPPDAKDKNPSAQEAAVKDAVTLLYTKYTHAFWVNKQWDDGFVAAFNGFGNKITAYHDEQTHPITNTSTTNVQPTDLTPVASIFKWLFSILLFGGLLWLVIWLFYRRKQEARAVRAAQRAAAQAQGRASSLFLTVDKLSPNYNAIVEEWNRLDNSVTYDPNTTGLSADEYANIEKAWTALAHSIENLHSSSSKSTPPSPITPPVRASSKKPKHQKSATSQKMQEQVPYDAQRGRGDPIPTYIEPEPIILPVIIDEPHWRDKENDYRSDPEPEHRMEPSREEINTDDSMIASSADPEPSSNDSEISSDPEPDINTDDSSI